MQIMVISQNTCPEFQTHYYKFVSHGGQGQKWSVGKNYDQHMFRSTCFGPMKNERCIVIVGKGK